MTVVSATAPRAVAGPVLLSVLLAGAVGVRTGLAGVAGASSVPAGLAFAAVLLAVVAVVRPPTAMTVRVVVTGLAGALLLAAPAVVSRGVADVHPAGGFTGWAVATAVVATAEEAFLRGSLFTAVERRRGIDAAVVVTAAAFAALHVPLYGWHVVPLDLAVGLALGAMRVVAGSWTAPAVAHVGADLVGWWLV